MVSHRKLSTSHIIGIREMSEEDIQKILDYAKEMKNNPFEYSERLNGKILALAFWEPSTRTRLSFESAMLRLGGRTIGFSSQAGTSLEKGESLTDTIIMLAGYSDGIVIRHPLRGSAKLAANVAERYGIPIISGGSGSQEHPTQALLDIFTINERFNRLSGLNIGLIGDLRYSRTISSLLFALSKFGRNRISLFSHPSLGLQEELHYYLTNTNLELIQAKNLAESISELDVLYVTRLQKERFPDPMLYNEVKGIYQLRTALLNSAKPELIILHPLPRVDEIPYEIDKSNHALYFEQAKNGVYVRMSILDFLIGS
ncbi:MAG: aspartate carbamoyltransferase [Candidatus Heimdallarchaeota archaeon]|nr:MAG: aspartate carbamoyltransferase [Candidatus Heimdallarchaeota archaeon]